MISLRAPKILIRRPSQAELEFLLGLSRSSRSIFSPSLTAQTYRTEAEAFTGQSKCVIRSRAARVLAFARFIKTFLETAVVIFGRNSLFSLPLKCLSGTAGVPPANEREARKWTNSDFRKNKRHVRVAGDSPGGADRHLIGSSFHFDLRLSV